MSSLVTAASSTPASGVGCGARAGSFEGAASDDDDDDDIDDDEGDDNDDDDDDDDDDGDVDTDDDDDDVAASEAATVVWDPAPTDATGAVFLFLRGGSSSVSSTSPCRPDEELAVAETLSVADGPQSNSKADDAFDSPIIM